MISSVADEEKPLKPSQLKDTKSELVKTLIQIYTMESFIVYNLNKASYN